jgi:hypothetical protein
MGEVGLKKDMIDISSMLFFFRRIRDGFIIE